MISPSCTAPALTAPGSHVASFLRTCHNDNVQGRVMAEFVFNELGCAKQPPSTTAAPMPNSCSRSLPIPLWNWAARSPLRKPSTWVTPICARADLDCDRASRNSCTTPSSSPRVASSPPSPAKEIAGLEETILAGADGMTSPDFVAAAGEAGEGMYFSGPSLAFTGERYDQLPGELQRDQRAGCP
jgi:hypothetical protein